MCTPRITSWFISCCNCLLREYYPNYDSCSCIYCVSSFPFECMACIFCCYDPCTIPYVRNNDFTSNIGYTECFEPYRCACCPLTFEEYDQYKTSKYTCRAMCIASCCDSPEILQGVRPHFLNANSQAFKTAECNQMCLCYLHGPFSILGYILECVCVATSMMCSCSTNMCKDSCSNNSCVGCCCFNDLSSLCQEEPPTSIL